VPARRCSFPVDHDPAAAAALIMRRSGSRSRREVDLYKAAAEDTLGFTYRGTFGTLSPYAGIFVFLGDADEVGSFSLTGGLSTTLGT
jgi:hypothetical protein